MLSRLAAGRAWKARDLRIKSSVELHQLWYVLLKERNMLLTVKQDAKLHTMMMPSPERLKKVRALLCSCLLCVGFM
jgi:large subunit ribosomal protein L47